MDKLKITYILCAAILVAITLSVVLSQSTQQTEKENTSNNYRDTHTYVYNVKETAYLSSDEDDNGLDYGWYAGFDWRGTFAIAIDKIRVYCSQSGSNDYSTLVGNQGMALISDYSDPVSLVKVKLRIKNIDAVSRSDEDPFNATVFNLSESITAGDIPFIDPGTAALENPTEKDACKYIVEIGKEETITIGWFVDESAIQGDLHLVIGASGYEKYSFVISPNDVEKSTL